MPPKNGKENKKTADNAESTRTEYDLKTIVRTIVRTTETEMQNRLTNLKDHGFKNDFLQDNKEIALKFYEKLFLSLLENNKELDSKIKNRCINRFRSSNVNNFLKAKELEDDYDSLMKEDLPKNTTESEKSNSNILNSVEKEENVSKQSQAVKMNILDIKVDLFPNNEASNVDNLKDLLSDYRITLNDRNKSLIGLTSNIFKRFEEGYENRIITGKSIHVAPTPEEKEQEEKTKNNSKSGTSFERQ